MSLELISTSSLNGLTLGPPCVAITLADVKAHLRIDFSDDDAVLSSTLASAIDYVEAVTGQQILPATLKYTLDRFPNAREIILPRPPLRSVNSIRYVGRDGSEVTFPADFYRVDAARRPGRIILLPGKCWPADSEAACVSIEFDAGPYDDRPLSPSLRQAVLFLTGHWYEHREAATDRRIDEVPLTFINILNQQSFPEAL